jgi:hypothetical protein
VVALVVWVLLRPALDGAVTSFAQLLIRAYEYPKVTRLVVVDNRAEVRRADLRSDSALPTVALTEIHFNTIVFLALCLALPRPWSRKQLERLVMGWSLLYLSQSLNLLFHVKFLYASAFSAWSLQHYSTVARNVFGFLQYASDLPGRFAFPFAIWLGFNWNQVMPIVGLSSAPKAGSGRSGSPAGDASHGTERARRIVRMRSASGSRAQ